MSRARRIAEGLTENARVVLVVLLLATALVGAGVTMLEDETSFDQFQEESPETRAQDYVDENFVDNESENTTAAQLVTTGDNVLSQESLIESLEFQQAVWANESVNGTLTEGAPITGVENVLAMAAIGDELEERSDALNETRDQLRSGLNETRELQREFEEDTAELDENSSAYQEREAELEADVEAVVEEVTADVDEDRRLTYESAVRSARAIETRLVELEREYGEEEARERATYRQLEGAELEEVYNWATTVAFSKDFQQIEYEAEQIEDDSQQPPLDRQIEALEDLNESELEALIVDTIDGDGPGGNQVLRLLPASYELGSTTAEARMTVLEQETDGSGGVEVGVPDPRVIESQLDLRTLSTEHERVDGEHEYLVFGGGIIEDEIDRSMGDSLWIVGPLTLLFVVVALTVAYRDPLDIALGVVGILAVLLWTFGLVGWIGIPFSMLFVAIPILLIGLSVDYAIHVFMRYRERRDSTDGRTAEKRGSATNGVRDAMTVALAGVGVALVWITATTAMGFVANAVSPLGLLQEFGVVGAMGIVSALIVFGALIPAAKVELDSALEARGYDRRKRAFGTGGGRFSRVLSVGAVAARRAPLAVLLVALLLTAGGVYGATQVDTTFEEEEFMPQSQPEWTSNLPGPMAPGDYQAADDLDVINEHFHRQDSTADIVVRGNVTEDDSLVRLADAADEAAGSEIVYTLPNGEADIVGPLSVMERVADTDDDFNESYQAALNDDGIPDENVSALYDDLFDADEAAASEVIHRTDGGEYEGVRLTVAVEADAAYAETAAEMRAIAETLDEGGNAFAATDGEGDAGAGADEEDEASAGETQTDAWTAVATGSPITNHIIEVDLFKTVLEGLVVAFVGAFVFLTVAYRVTGNSATLGAVTLAPIALSVSWILGTMYLLGIPFNVLTVTVAALTIGLGVDYCIHVSSRYKLELERQGNVWEALHTTVTGTGGALLGSAATTVGAFATLGFGLLPVFRQFGIVTGLTVGYAFLASVLVLPALLVLWTRYLGPTDVSFDRPSAEGDAVAVGDGGAADRETNE